MYKYYLRLDNLTGSNKGGESGKILTKENKSEKISVKAQHKILESPRELRKIISNENFIKYQWAWTI